MLAPACHRPSPSAITQIAIQPIYPYDSSRLPLLRSDLVRVFRHPVILLTPIHLPQAFLNHEKGERYSADSIVDALSKSTGDSITQVVGFTSEDIFTTRTDPEGHVLQPADRYGDWGIFGLAARPGKASVLSDFRLTSTDENIYRHRLHTVLLHEMGHNLGLPHCPNPRCIMNDANEKIATVDNSGNDFCRACRRALHL